MIATQITTSRGLPALALALLFATAGLIGCGGDPPQDEPDNQNQLNQEPDNQNQDPGNQIQDPDHNQSFDPSVIPAYLIVDVSPTRFAYALDTRVTPRARAYNYQWQPLGEVPVEWTVTPAELVEKDDPHDRWYLREQGQVTFEACAVDALPSHPACASHTVHVADGPTVTLETPIGGDHFSGQNSDTVLVEGVVTSARDINRVQINGIDVPIDSDRRFSYEYTPNFGVNTIIVRAFDGLHPLDGLDAASFIWAPDFLPTEHDGTSLHTQLDTALIMRLGQNFFDDGSNPTMISDSQILTEDLADIIYLVLLFLDLGAQLPDPVVDSSGFYLSVPEVQIGEPRVEIDTTSTGLQIFAQLQDIHAVTSGHLDFADQLLNLDGSIEAGLAVFAEVDVEKTSANEPVTVELVNFAIAIENATGNFASDEANAIFELADSLLRESLETILLDSVNLSFIDTLPDLLTDVFTSLEEAIAYQPFDVDVGVGDPLLLEFYGQISQLLPTYLQGIEGIVEAQLAIETARSFPDNPGVAVMTSGPRPLPLFDESRIQIGLDLALINAIFNNLWDAGLLDLDISTMVPPSLGPLLQTGHATGMLPPVAAPPVGNQPYDLLLHLGQLELDLGWATQTDRFGARLAVGANLLIQDDAIAIEISDDPDIELWLIDSTEESPFLDAGGLISLIRNQLWPQIDDALGEGLSFSLPIPDLAGLDEFSPELADLDLDIRMTRPLEVREGFLILEAAFEGELFLD